MLTLAALTLGIAQPVQATDNTVVIRAISSVSCIPSSLMTVTVQLAISQNSLRVVRQLFNPVRNTTTASTTIWDRRSGTYDFLVTIPQNTQPGDSLHLTVALATVGGVAISHDEIQFSCSIGQIEIIPTTPGPPVGTASDTPCGIFTVTEWGRKTILFADYPACGSFTPDLTVACLRVDGAWTADQVHNIIYSSDGKQLSFDVTQHGHCGLFPKPGG